MRNFLSFLTLSLVLIFASSCKEETGSVDLNFVATYNGEPIIYGNEYDFADGVKLQFDDIKFFVSNVQLEEDGGSFSTVKDVDFVEFRNAQNSTLAAEGIGVSGDQIEAKSYKGIRMNIGLTKELNDTKKADADGDSPLQTGSYWSNWESYIFVSISARADLDSDGTFEHNLVYHLGGEESINTREFDKNIDVTGGDVTTLNFDFDLKKAFMPDGIPFNIEAIPTIHKERVIMGKFAKDVNASFDLK